MSDERGAWVAGVDGCRGGWLVVRGRAAAARNRFAAVTCEVVTSFAEVLALTPRLERIAVDMPIGLREVSTEGPRPCDGEARRRLVDPQRRISRASSVFPPPPRRVLALRDDEYRRIRDLNGGVGVSKQAFNLRHKIAELDALMTRRRQTRVFESHPELCFCTLAGHPMAHAKRTARGRDERLALVAPWLPAATKWLGRYPRRLTADDDILDACALLWTARRAWRGRAQRLPAQPPRDARGLRMEIVV